MMNKKCKCRLDWNFRVFVEDRSNVPDNYECQRMSFNVFIEIFLASRI